MRDRDAVPSEEPDANEFGPALEKDTFAEIFFFTYGEVINVERTRAAPDVEFVADTGREVFAVGCEAETLCGGVGTALELPNFLAIFRIPDADDVCIAPGD